MERVQVLIERLVEQKQRNETPAQLLVTVQLLQQELTLQQQPAVNAAKKISVVMPAQAVHFPTDVSALQDAPAPKQKEQTPEPPKPVELPKETIPPIQSYSLRRPSITELLQERGEQKEAAPRVPVATPTPVSSPSHFDIVAETPTLLQHTPQEEKKIHSEVAQIIRGEQHSLNDQLRQQKTEVAHLLQDTPVKDLRKAIGINDKFVFLNELFNGDDAAYERSIKTINNFHVLQEAEYWINRELKLRLGWNDTAETVQHFYQLVRRRFS